MVDVKQKIKIKATAETQRSPSEACAHTLHGVSKHGRNSDRNWQKARQDCLVPVNAKN
jgi:hypothetical protein